MAGTTLPISLGRARSERLASAAYFLRRNPRMIIGGLIVIAWLLAALFAPFVAPYDPIKVNVIDSLQPPNPQHWLGTDDLGRDVLSRVIWGSRVSLSVGLISVSIGLLVGTSVGLAAGFAILAEAALSFLGLGPQPPYPSWGQDINYSQRYLPNLKWWMSVGPGIAIFTAVFAFNFLGDALRDALDPRLRRSG